ncbi:hypothetical protein CBL_08571 [Carabus blaptoides fortunei]
MWPLPLHLLPSLSFCVLGNKRKLQQLSLLPGDYGDDTTPVLPTKRKKYLLSRQRAWKVKESTCHSYRNSGEQVKESSVDDQQYEKTVGEMVKSKGPEPSKCRRLTSFLLIGNLRENKTVDVLHCKSV